jgi:hypothetical protein
MRNAERASSVSMQSDNAQPTTHHEYRSRRAAKDNHPSLVEMYVMSPATTWFGAGALKSRPSRFGTTRFVCCESSSFENDAAYGRGAPERASIEPPASCSVALRVV